MNIRKVSLAFMAFAMAFSLSAYDFISGNLAYKINADGQSVTVTSLGSGNSQYGYPSSLTGNLKIPVALAEGGKTYTVTAIDDYAFYNCSGLTNVKLPSSLKSIGNYAFYGCSGLTDVIIPASVEAIGNYTFYGCSSISSITVGKGVKRIGVSTFIGCAAITSVTWNVVNLANQVMGS